MLVLKLFKIEYLYILIIKVNNFYIIFKAINITVIKLIIV